MKILELVGDQADVALEALDLVEASLQKNLRETFDNFDQNDKLRLIQGLCAILYIRSLRKFYGQGEDPAEILLLVIRESVEWEADKGRDGAHAKYQALKVLESSFNQDAVLFHEQLEMLEKDQKQDSLSLPQRSTENVTRELVNWFRYYSWFGYGKTGPENCREGLALVRDDVSYLLANGNLRHLN